MPSTILSSEPPTSLAIISAPPHYLWRNRLWSYGPYTQEIDLWADLFDEIRIVGPLKTDAPPDDAVPFQRSNISMDPVLDTGGDTLLAKFKQLVLLPYLLVQLAVRIRRAQAVHVRGPANLGLLSSLIAPLLGRPMIAKYAGQWRTYPGERRPVALQRWIFRKWFRGPVTVYGKLPGDPSHIVDFFTSMLSEEQISSALALTANKPFHQPMRVLFSGRLYNSKGLTELINAAALLRDRVPLELRIVGDGPLREAAEALVESLGLDDRVEFVGAMPHEQALQQFAWADAVVLASRHEGWPKVLTEAMVHHCLAVAPDAGIMGTMIENRGCVLRGLDAKGIAATLEEVANNMDHYHSLLPAAAEWAAGHSKEGLRTAIANVLRQHWQTEITEARRNYEPSELGP